MLSFLMYLIKLIITSYNFIFLIFRKNKLYYFPTIYSIFKILKTHILTNAIVTVSERP